MLSIQVLGGFAILRDGQPIDESSWRHRKSAKNLIKILALEHNHRLHREQISDLLWPDLPPDSGAAQVRKAIHTARHALDADLQPRQESRYLTVQGAIVSLEPDTVSIDLDLFRSAAREAVRSDDESMMARAIEAYTGPVLPEDQYEIWREDAAREGENLARELLAKLAEGCERRRTYGQAVDYLRALLKIDPTDESVYAHVMRIHVEAGSRHGVLLTYRECRHVLNDQLGVEPSEEIEQLHLRALSGEVEHRADGERMVGGPERLAAETGPFVGREEELSTISHAITTSIAGRGGVVVLTGEAGAGKSRLAIVAAHRAIDEEMTVLWGSGYEESLLIPYALFTDMLTDYTSRLPVDAREAFIASSYPELANLFPEGNQSASTKDGRSKELDLSADTPIQEQARILHGVRRLIADLCANHPVLMVVDDIQRVDSASLQLLRHINRSASRSPLLILITHRPEGEERDEVSEFLRLAFSDFSATQLQLSGLNPEASKVLVRELLGNREGTEADQFKIADRIHEWSLGNPLFITELAQVADRQGLGSIVPLQEASTPIGRRDDFPVEPRLSALTAERIRSLSPKCRRLLGLAAVAGLQWSFQAVHCAAAKALDGLDSESEIVELCDEAIRANILDEADAIGGWGYRFRHPVLQAVMYNSLSKGKKLLFHRELGRAINTVSPDDVELVAYHASRSDDVQLAVESVSKAAERATRLYANEAAAAYFEELARLKEKLGLALDAAQARIEMAKSLLQVSRYDSARDVLSRTVADLNELGDVDGHARAVSLLALLEAENGNGREGMSLLTPVVDQIDRIADGERRIEVLLLMAKVTFLCGEYEASLEAGSKMLQEANTLTDTGLRDWHLGQAESCLGTAQLMLGQWEEACVMLARAIEHCESAGDLESLSRALNNLGSAFADAGRFVEAKPYLERALEMTRRTGEPTKIAWQLCVLANIRNLLGDWDGCESLLLEALEELAVLEDSWITAYPFVQLANLYTPRGQIAKAAELTERALALAEKSGDLQLIRWSMGRVASNAMAEERWQEAIDRITPVLDRPGLEESDVTNLLPLLAEAYIRVDLDKAKAIAENSVIRSRKQNDAISLVDALYVRALVALEENDLARAAADVEEILEIAERTAYPYPRAQALFLKARLLAESGGAIDAVESHLGESEEILVRLKAGQLLEKVRELQASLGKPGIDNEVASQPDRPLVAKHGKA